MSRKQTECFCQSGFPGRTTLASGVGWHDTLCAMLKHAGHLTFQQPHRETLGESNASVLASPESTLKPSVCLADSRSFRSVQAMRAGRRLWHTTRR